VAGLMEFYALAKKRQLSCFPRVGILLGAILMAGTFFQISEGIEPARANEFEMVILILLVLGLCVRQFLAWESNAGIVAIATTLFGFFYVAWLLNFIQKIHFYPDVEGSFFILYFIVVTKFSDLGAYVTGSLIGKHKMIPRVSPNKTWEGFGGAILISTGASLLLVILAGERLAGMNLIHGVVLGGLLSVAAVMGDLVESLFKREAGVKDSGNFFPGIGGILDVLDSLLFNAPIMYLYLRYVLNP
jgi:phosphatidate cytidylyltransferase